MIHRVMKYVIWAGIAMMWVMMGLVTYDNLFAQQPQLTTPRVEIEITRRPMYELPADGYIPDVIVVKRSLKPTAMVCAEPLNQGTVSCRTVAEFRVWVSQRTELK